MPVLCRVGAAASRAVVWQRASFAGCNAPSGVPSSKMGGYFSLRLPEDRADGIAINAASRLLISMRAVFASGPAHSPVGRLDRTGPERRTAMRP